MNENIYTNKTECMNYRAFWYLIPNQVIRSKSMFVFTNQECIYKQMKKYLNT